MGRDRFRLSCANMFCRRTKPIKRHHGSCSTICFPSALVSSHSKCQTSIPNTTYFKSETGWFDVHRRLLAYSALPFSALGLIYNTPALRVILYPPPFPLRRACCVLLPLCASLELWCSAQREQRWRDGEHVSDCSFLPTEGRVLNPPRPLRNSLPSASRILIPKGQRKISNCFYTNCHRILSIFANEDHRSSANNLTGRFVATQMEDS